jgi:branched-chain amino acid transport system ATP-binding protein
MTTLTMETASANGRHEFDQAVLEVSGVSVRFSGVNALTDVGLTVGNGQVVSLIGPNGAGKTTLFNVIAGEQRHDSGTVQLLGEDLSRLSPQQRSQRGIVRTFQRMELFEGLTVRENLVVARELSGRLHLAREILRRDRISDGELVDAAEVLEELGLQRVANRLVGELPTGLRRLVELGRTLMVPCHLVLLDEPTSGLDPDERALMKGVIRAMAKAARRRSVLLVEHDMGVALELADHAYVLDFGEIIADGSAAEVRADPRVQAAYLGMGL